MIDRLDTFSPAALGELWLPRHQLVVALERRLSAADLSYPASLVLERRLQSLLVEDRDTSRLIAQGRRLLTVERGLTERVRFLLADVRSVPGVQDATLWSLLDLRPLDRLLRLRVAYGALANTSAANSVEAAELKTARGLARSIAGEPEATVRERAEAHYLLGRLAVLDGRPEDATPHLVYFHDLHLEHAVCPASMPTCDRDYALHLIATSDWARLESYQERKKERAAALRAVARSKVGDKLDKLSPLVLERMHLQLIYPDTELATLFAKPGCEPPTALPHRPGRQTRPCVHDAPRPWAHETPLQAVLLRAREAALLLSARYPRARPGQNRDRDCARHPDALQSRVRADVAQW